MTDYTYLSKFDVVAAVGRHSYFHQIHVLYMLVCGPQVKVLL